MNLHYIICTWYKRQWHASSTLQYHDSEFVASPLAPALGASVNDMPHPLCSIVCGSSSCLCSAFICRPSARVDCVFQFAARGLLAFAKHHILSRLVACGDLDVWQACPALPKPRQGEAPR
eukprot:1159758-Pelagomonas_calceolata.AAC.8